MNACDLVTFLSDFGWGGGYVAACEATIARLRPSARVLHVAHDVGVGDIAAGALILARIAPLCPPAVHLAVIDPGVGTARRPVVLSTSRGDLLVGPDNGLLPEAAMSLGGLQGAWTLDVQRVRRAAGLPPGPISNTFHGRDLFAPAAALLAGGLDPRFLGETAAVTSLTSLVHETAASMEDGKVLAPVIEVDRFGNVGLAIGFKQLAAMVGEDLESGPPAVGEYPAGRLPAGAQFVVEVVGEYPPEWRARIVRTFGDLEPGELGLIQDSWGQAALALNGASAAELLSARRGVIVRLTPFAGRCQAGWGTTRPGNASPGHPGSEKGGRDRMQPNDGFGEFRSGSRS